jgi:hypothetical protein
MAPGGKKLIKDINQFWDDHPELMYFSREDVKHWFCEGCGQKYKDVTIAFTDQNWGSLWTKVRLNSTQSL